MHQCIELCTEYWAYSNGKLCKTCVHKNAACTIHVGCILKRVYRGWRRQDWERTAKNRLLACVGRCFDKQLLSAHMSQRQSMPQVMVPRAQPTILSSWSESRSSSCDLLKGDNWVLSGVVFWSWSGTRLPLSPSSSVPVWSYRPWWLPLLLPLVPLDPFIAPSCYHISH